MLIEHHVKYKEIHGLDETVWMEKSEHDKLHKRLRKEGKCKIPVDVLNNISKKANQRTKKYKLWKKEYDRQKRPIVEFIDFQDTIGLNIVLFERIIFTHEVQTP